jgi:SAM-dependent methyltransferase
MSGNAFWQQHGDTWARRSEHGLPNAAYDRPAILRLAGDVTGRRILELGCAAGVLTRQLVDRGASVLALEREPRMAALARQRLEGRARVEVADLEQPLDMVPDACIDLVVASLVLHYIEDWRPLLGELHRCLVPGGALVFSIHHPITGWQLSGKADYHRTELVSEQYDYGGQLVTVQMTAAPSRQSSANSVVPGSPWMWWTNHSLRRPESPVTPSSCISCRPSRSSCSSERYARRAVLGHRRCWRG